MTVALILVVLAILAAIAVVLINRTTGARPDRPMEGADDDANIPTREDAAPEDAAPEEAALEESSREADQPGGPGQESMNPAHAGDPSPGPSEDDQPHP